MLTLIQGGTRNSIPVKIAQRPLKFFIDQLSARGCSATLTFTSNPKEDDTITIRGTKFKYLKSKDLGS